MILGGDLVGNAAIFKITPNGTLTHLCVQGELRFQPGG